MYRLDKCMQTIATIMEGYDTEHFFNENDLGIVCEIGLRELATPNTSRTRVHTLRVLNLILDHPTFL